MDLNWLHDFACLGRTLNFTRAAEERNITQSAFSRRIKSLESWLGVPLIVRSTYPVQLSEAGRAFLPVAREAISSLTDIRQEIRDSESGDVVFQKIAVLHIISVNYLNERIAKLESEFPSLRVRVVSDYLPVCCQLFSDGACDFLLHYRSKQVVPVFDDNTYLRKDIGVEKFAPVADAEAAANGGWDLSAGGSQEIPYLSYDPTSYLGTVVDQIIGSRKPRLALRYMDAHGEALKRRMLAGSGIAWLPDRAVEKELASGQVVQVGGPEWQTDLTLSLLCAPDRLDDAGRLFYEAL